MAVIKHLILFIALYLFAVEAYSAVFTVSSNSDAGSGTLREALTLAAANGSIDKDFIYFNLIDLSEAGRTITILSKLPDVSSNLSIDASTQPGSVFGVSTARVQLITAFSVPSTHIGLTLLNLRDVEIYALYIRNLTPYKFIDRAWQGISVSNCKNISIGATGKGNVIIGFLYEIGVNVPEPGSGTYYCENMSIKANFISIEPDGVTLSQVYTATRQIIWYVSGQIEIGGTPDESNLFAKGLHIQQANAYNYTDPGTEKMTLPATFNVSNNKIGVDYSGAKGISGSRGFFLATHNPNGKNTVEMNDNIISSSDDYGIFIINNGRPVSIKRNYIGTDKTLTQKLPMAGEGIFIYSCDGVQIGSNAPADANHIAYCKPVHIWPYSTVAINKNSFFCTVNAYPMISSSTYGTRPYPVISIQSIASGSISGTATPNSSIELFYSDNCGTCSPETYFASTTANAAGNWQYNGPLSGTVIASATYNNATSEFTRTRIDGGQVKVVHTCSNTGSIKGVLPVSASSVKWLDENGNIVGTSPDLLNMPPGKYKLQVANGACMAEASYQIQRTLSLNTSNVKTANPSCGISNGYIRGVIATNNTPTQTIYSWKDGSGKEVGKTTDINNLGAGSYTLTVKTADNTCSENYGPVLLQNASAPAINQSSIIITPASCQNTGSITGMIITGPPTLSYKWKNQLGLHVSVTKDLVNQPPGTYTLEVSDAQGCISTSQPIVVPVVNGINLDDSGLKINSSSCSLPNGSITGISVAGATSYSWLNETGQVISSSLDLNNISPGKYKLSVSNSFCTKETGLITVTALPSKVFSLTVITTTQASCGLNNGSLTVAANGDQPKAYKWMNGAGNILSSSTTLTNAPVGGYKLYLTDDNGCESFYKEYAIENTPPLQADQATISKKNDRCNLHEAAISGIKISGGKLPYSYQWTDANGKSIGSTADVQNIPSGSYHLQVSDATSCNKLVLSYLIQNSEQEFSAPIVPPSQLCAAGNVKLQVSNPLPGKYLLYNEEHTEILDESNTGTFEINVSRTSDYYMSYRLGDCESDPTRVRIEVGITAEQISNKISPNGDGINDQWLIEGLQYYPNADVKIYNRSGTVVYQSKGYLKPFDGTRNGSPLPVGAYYYTIDFGAACNRLSGNLNLLR